MAFGADGFQSGGIFGGDLGIVDLARHQINPAYIRMFCQGPGEFDHVFCLAAGIGIAAEFQIMAAYQAVYADQGNIETSFRSNNSVLPMFDEIIIELPLADCCTAPTTDGGCEFRGIVEYALWHPVPRQPQQKHGAEGVAGADAIY